MSTRALPFDIMGCDHLILRPDLISCHMII